MSKGPKKSIRLGKENLFNVITSPVLTEKSTKASEYNKVTFTVNLNATKPEIQKAVEEGVQVFGGIDILINNASAIQLTGTSETPMKKFDLM